MSDTNETKETDQFQSEAETNDVADTSTSQTTEASLLETCEKESLTEVETWLKEGSNVNNKEIQNGIEWTPLLKASYHGYVEITTLCLKTYGAQVDLQNNDGWTALMVASMNGHSEVVKLLHQYGAQVDLQNNDGWTALMLASENGHHEVVKLLLEYSAKVDLQNNNGRSALMKASKNGHCEVVILLHEYGAQNDLQNKNGSTALILASQNGHCEVVKLLHEYGAQVDLQNNRGWSALMKASKKGHSKIVELLHEYGAQIDLQSKYFGMSALMIASYNGHYKVVKLLNDYDAKVDLQDKNGGTALMRASIRGHCEVVKILLESSAQLEVKNNKKSTALMIACHNGQYEVAKLLLRHGAQVNIQNKNLASTLMIACDKGDIEVVMLLHEYSAQLDVQATDGLSALMLASYNGYSKVVNLLLEYGAQVDQQNNSGWTALMIASQNGHCEVIKHLCKYTAQINLQNKRGSTALIIASQNGHCEVIKLLHEYGAKVDLHDNNGWSALMIASLNGHWKVVKLLHEFRTKTNLPHDRISEKPSHPKQPDVSVSKKIATVCQIGDIEEMESLLNGPCQLSQEEIVEALLLASQNGHNNIVEVIIQRCGHVNSTDEKGQSALIVASQHGHSEVVKTLIDHGAEVDVQDNNGMSPLMCASQNGHKDVVKNILSKAPQVNLENREGWTALMFACWNCNSEIVEILLKHRAHIDGDFVTKIMSSSTHFSIASILSKQIESDGIQKRHLAVVQEAIDQQGALTHTTVHGVIVGLARSGKDSLMKRFLGEMPSGKSPSTGVAEKVIQVRVERSSTIAANVEDSKWTRLTEYDDEAVEMMTQLTAKQNPEKQSEETLSKGECEIEETCSEVTDSGQVNQTKSSREQIDSKVQVVTDQELPTPTVQVQSAYESLDLVQSETVTHKLPLNVFKDALKSKGLTGLREHLENYWSLYLSNTGGQMEFQELLPLLVSGPSIIFVTFRLDRELNEIFEIEFELAITSEKSSDFKSCKYISSATPLETILQTLATFDAVGTFEYSNQQRERVALTYKVFIIGTHRDILEKVHEEESSSKIKEIDRHIQEVVKGASYYKHIQYSSRDQMIFTVNNFSESDSDFQHIRLSVQRVIDTGDFRMTTPSHWLIYSLVLRQLKSRIESYDNCFRIARDCGITSHEEHKEALHFIHTKMGLIRYFPQDELDQIVFLDPQILFDKVTELITDTFTFEKVGKQIEDDFNNGIFSFTDFEKLQCLDYLLSPYQLVKVLQYLHIAAPFHQDGVLKYFLPCAIPHADKPSTSSTQAITSQSIPPLVVSFVCGYRPMGLAGALITYLMTNVGQHTDLQWNLLTDEIYRDQISFIIEPSCDTVVLKIFPTHLEVTFLPDPNDSDRIGSPVEKVCREIWTTIKAGIERVNSDINYIRNMEPIFTFYCQAEGCKVEEFHQVKLFPGKLFCPKSKKSCKLKEGHSTWMLQNIPKSNIKKSASFDTDVSCNSKHLAVLSSQLQEHAADWKDIATHLGFSQGELRNIESAPKHFNGAPKSYLSAMLAEWLEWAPEDERGSKSYATLSGLKSALREAGLGRTAEELRLSSSPQM